MRRSTRILAIAAVWLAAGVVHATDVRHWQRKPIAIDLPVGAERIVVFGADVRVGLPPKLANPDTLRVQSTRGAVYLKADDAFDTQRVQVQNVATGRIILLDLAATSGASDETVRVVAETPDDPPNEPVASGSETAESAGSRVPREAFTGQASGAPTPVRVVRHAAQALYAPQRLITARPGIQRVAVTPTHTLSALLPAYPVDATPLAAWRAAGYTVTAIEIVNRDPRRTFTLDPRGLAGDFHAAGFMQPDVGPAGTLTDTTTLFAVTANGDLADVLVPSASDVSSEGNNAD